MPKNTKSSASSATRKKQAAKAARKAGTADDATSSSQQQNGHQAGSGNKALQRGQKKDKGKKGEPKKKVYVPPSKPKADVIDPLDALGLASMLPSDLVLLLRKASKKDMTTRIRALEGLLEWLKQDGDASQMEENRTALITALPSWTHLFPRAVVSPNRRLRQLSIQVSARILEDRDVLQELHAQESLADTVLGPMLVVAHGTDRLVSRMALTLFESITTWDRNNLAKINLNDYAVPLIEHLASIIFHSQQTSDEAATRGGERGMQNGTSSATSNPLSVAREAKNRDDINVEEDADSTDARLVAGALGSLSWIINAHPSVETAAAISPLLSHRMLWSSLLSKNEPQEARSLGHLSPYVRIAAWNLTRILVLEWPQGLDHCIHELGPSALRAAYTESDVLVAQTMRESLVRLLRSRPEVWRMVETDDNDNDDDEDDKEVNVDQDDDVEDQHDILSIDQTEGDSEDEPEKEGPTTTSASERNAHLLPFLDYLRGGVCGVASSYGLVLLLLATIPDDVLPATSQSALDILQALYSPMDEATLEGRDNTRAFVTAFLENLVWLTGRVAAKGSKEEAVKVAGAIRMLWYDCVEATTDDESSTISKQAGVDSRLGVLDEGRLASELGECLRKLGGIDLAFAEPILRLAQSVFAKSLTTSSVNVELVCDLLETAFASKGQDQQSETTMTSLQRTISELVNDVTFTTANVVASGEAVSHGTGMLVVLLTRFAKVLKNEAALKALQLAFTCLLENRPSEMSGEEAASFSVIYASLLSTDEERNDCWVSLLDSLVRPSGTLDWSLLRALLQAVSHHKMPTVNAHSERFESTFFERYGENVSVSARLLAMPESIVSRATTQKVLEQVIDSQRSSSELVILEEWLRADEERSEHMMQSHTMSRAVPRIFEAANFNNDRQAGSVWKLIGRNAKAAALAKELLQGKVLQVNDSLSAIFLIACTIKPAISLADLVPAQSSLQDLFVKSCIDSEKRPSLSIHDELVPVTSNKDYVRDAQQTLYDKEGLSPVARAFSVLLGAMEDDLSLREPHYLPHLVTFAIAAEDTILERDCGRAFFNSTASLDQLASYLKRSVSLATSIVSSRLAESKDGWFKSLCTALQRGPNNQDAEQGVSDKLHEVLTDVWNTPGASRVFARMLRGCLNFGGAGQTEAVELLRAAQVAERSRPDNARAVYVATKDLILDAPLYERLCNQAAADLAGVKSSAASTQGVQILCTLNALAPPIDAYVSLIPQQRCVFLMRTIQTWFASDDELSPEVYIRLAQVFLHILPIVQDMPGNHLDLIIDVIETNLGDVNVTDEAGLVNLCHTLVLLDTLMRLAERSATLRDVWNDRKKDVFDALRQVLLILAEPTSRDAEERTSQEGVHRSNIRLTVEEALIDTLRFMPATIFKQDFDKLVRLLQYPAQSSLPVVVYRILSQLIRENVKELVVEAAMRSAEERRRIENMNNEEDAEQEAIKPASFDPKLLRIPAELVAILDRPQGVSAFAYLLAWLAVFEYFEESSMELRAAYTTQLQHLRVVDARLIPMISSTLSDQTSDPSNKWALEEVYLDDLFDEKANVQASVDVLTIHVFYRSLIHTPNLVCDAFFSLKDRQQSMALRNLTVRHLTPLLSQREFGHLRQPDVLARLQDENMQIKVLANANEVVATYTVDEYPLELAINMPTDYPLRPIEVIDLRKIGISEGTWRAWILGMRQLIAGRNGLIFDALLLFKRNVEAKFSGFDEDSTCAICYSIVSPTDHSLPTKPCKTCKKKFHASCLYKWVSTSGSSTCPLCRSIL